MYGHSHSNYGYGGARDQYSQAGSGRERDQYGYHGQSGAGGGSYHHRYQDQPRGGGYGGYGQGTEGRRTWSRDDGAGGWNSANYRSGGGAGASRDINTNSLSPFVKDFLSYSAPCRAVEISQVEEFRRDKEIKIMKGEESCPNPVIKFEAGGFPDYITKEVMKAGFTHPTPIQAQSFTIALSGQVGSLHYLWSS